MTTSRNRMPGLDALRGVAALMVLLFHTRGMVLPTSVLSHGYLAVDLFFVISGLVLARAHDEALRGGGGREFMRRRLVRLYPMVLLGMAVGSALLLASGMDMTTIGILIGLAVLFIPFTGATDVFPLNGPQWSLFWELAVNLLYAVVAPWLTFRRLVVLTVVGGVAHILLVLQFGTGSLGPHAGDWFAGGPRVIFGFFAGVLLARRLDSGSLRIPVLPIWVNLAVVCAILSAPVPEAGRAAFDLVAALILFPLLVGSAARAEVGRGHTLLDGLAAISYALYALHIPILSAAAEIIARGVLPGVPSLLIGGVALVIALVAAIAAHRGFEPWAALRLRNLGRAQPRSTSRPSSITR